MILPSRRLLLGVAFFFAQTLVYASSVPFWGFIFLRFIKSGATVSTHLPILLEFPFSSERPFRVLRESKKLFASSAVLFSSLLPWLLWGDTWVNWVTLAFLEAFLSSLTLSFRNRITPTIFWMDWCTLCLPFKKSVNSFLRAGRTMVRLCFCEFVHHYSWDSNHITANWETLSLWSIFGLFCNECSWE